MVKIRLSVNEPAMRLPGYVEIDPANQPGVNPADLSSFAEEGEAQEILASDMLDFYPQEHRFALVSHWASRLGRGGILSIGTIEAVEACRNFVESNDIQNFRSILFGPGNRRRLSCGTLPEIVAMATDSGLKVVRSYVKNFFSYVEAIRE